MNIVSRTIAGMIFILGGSIISFIAFFASSGKFFGTLIYGIPLIIIGFFILFNKKEDQIEQINYSKIKHKRRNK